MRISTILCVTAIALAPMAIATGASAQDRDAAVHRCLAQAQAQFPGTDMSVDRNRTAVYKACMTNAGFTP